MIQQLVNKKGSRARATGYSSHWTGPHAFKLSFNTKPPKHEIRIQIALGLFDL